MDFYGKPLNLREALTSWLMIGKLSGSTLRGWAKHTADPELSALVEPGNKEKLEAYLWGREFIDLLEHCPAKLERPAAALQAPAAPRSAPLFHLVEPGSSSQPASISPFASSSTRATAATAKASAPRTSANALRRAAFFRSSFTPTSSSACLPIPMCPSSWSVPAPASHLSAPSCSTSRLAADAGPCGSSSAISAHPRTSSTATSSSRWVKDGTLAAPRPRLLPRSEGKNLRPAAHPRKLSRALALARAGRLLLRLRRLQTHGSRRRSRVCLRLSPPTAAAVPNTPRNSSPS